MSFRILVAAASLLTAGAAGVTLTPAGAKVTVFRASLSAPPAGRAMPAGCTLVSTSRPAEINELDLEGQKQPFRAERNRAAAEGANALLVLTRMTISRHDDECPSTSPITDCPPSFGAWYRVVYENYTCTPEALQDLLSRGSRVSSN